MNHPRTVHPRRPGFFYRMMMSFIGLFDRWLHFSCRSFTQLASEKHERPLRTSERMRQTMHRLMCGMCRRQEQHMDRLHSLSRELGSGAGQGKDAGLSQEATERIEQALKQALQNQTGGSPFEPGPNDQGGPEQAE